MANQITINIGAAANDGTGDPLRTAFNDVNLNFANVWNTGLPSSNVQFSDNRILTVNTNANLVLAPNGIGIVQSNVDIIPSINRGQSLGSSSKKWNTINSYYVNVDSANIRSFTNLTVAVANLHISGGSNGYVLQTDGTGNLTWTAQTGGSGNGTPGGANTQVQFNDAGSFGGAAGFTFNKTSNVLTVAGNISAGNVSIANLAAAHNINATTASFSGDQYSDGAMYVGYANGTVLGSDVVIQITANSGSYSQTNFQNINSGGAASSDYIITADNGNNITHFIDLGMTSSGWDGSQNNVLAGLTPNNGYLYVQDGNLTVGARNGNTSYSWNFGSDGTTRFPDYTINPGNNQPMAIRTQSSGNAYSTMYQSSGHWEAYAEDDETGADSGWAWIYAELPTVDTPQVWIENKTGSDGISKRWAFDAVGNLTLPNVANPSINYANGDPYGGAVNKIVNGSSSANIEFPSGNLAVGINLQNVTGAWINTYGNIVINDQHNTVGESVIVDEGGNVYVTGSVYNNDFGYDQAFVRKLNYTGAVMWQKALPNATDGSDESSGESLAIDGAGNLYWLANLWGGSIQDGSALVVKMNSSTGESVWSTLVQGGQYAQDITVTGAGQVFVTCDNNARITSLSAAGAVLWSFDPGNGGASLLDLGTFVLVGYGSGTVGAYNYDGDLLWINQVFNTGSEVWGLASDGTNWYAADRNGYIMKISGSDNSTILWQKYINRDGSGGNLNLTWIEYSDGYIYAGGTGNDGSGNYAFITVKILASDGSLVWARGLGASDTVGQWYWYGHQDLAVSGSSYLITGYARPAQSNANKQVLARLPVDGSLAGSTVGPYNYVNIPALILDDSDVGGAGYDEPAQPSTVTTTHNYTLNTLVAPYAEENILSPFTTGPVWSFNSDGNLVVPGSINATANNSLYLSAFNNGDNPSVGLFNWDVANSAPTTYLSVDAANVSIVTNVIGAGSQHEWKFAVDGSLIPPTQPSNDRTGSGLTLKIGDTNNQAIITGPAPVANTYNNAPRLVVAGQDGVLDGEGGDIYLWAGQSGPNGGSGGDIKVDAGYGQNGSDGGTIKVRGGNSTGGTGGFIEITGGHGDFGGPVYITGGYGNSQANSASVTITTEYGGNWVFDNYGNLTLPNGAWVKDTGGDSVAFGQNAGANNQSQHAVAIGLNAGQTNQGEDAVAIGWNAGANSQSRGIAIGWGAGYDNQGQYAQAYGKDAGSYYQQSDAVAIGDGAGRFLQKQEAIAIGSAAGYGTPQGATVASMQATNVVRIYGSTSDLYNGMTVVGGNITPGSGIFVVGLSGEDVTLSSDPPDPLTNGTNLNFYPAQSPGAIAIGSQSAQYLQAQNAVAVGYHAGQTRQGRSAVSIGEDAGNYVQGNNAIAIGRTAGSNGQGNSAIAMGWNAGQDNQGNSSIAIGEDAGQSSLGAYSIVIGRLAGYVNQGNNSIVLNATGANLSTANANTFTVAPIRSSTLNDHSLDTGNVLYYNTTTHEVTTAPLNNISGDPFAAYADGTGNVTVWTASSDQVVGAKLTVRVVYNNGGSYLNTEMLDITAAKTYPDGTPVFTVSNRVKTNPAYDNVLIDVNLAAGNAMQVISSAPSGAGNAVYWTCSATSFNQTFD